MSRFKRIRDWPNCLTRMQPDELQRELRYWQARIPYLGQPAAKKEAAQRVRKIEQEIESRGIPDNPDLPAD